MTTTTQALVATSHPPLHVVIFGRPGAGKSTVADAVVYKLQTNSVATAIGLDLDCCVSQQLRDNFGLGKYPTLEERVAFAVDACDYVEQEMSQSTTSKVYIVSFSFVNVDLRYIYNQRFPDAWWVLVDTSEQEAVTRISQRQGHFYKGAASKTSGDGDEDEENESNVTTDDETADADNADWKFAPVHFPHTKLNGQDAVETNANKIVDKIMRRVEEDCNIPSQQHSTPPMDPRIILNTSNDSLQAQIDGILQQTIMAKAKKGRQHAE